MFCTCFTLELSCFLTFDFFIIPKNEISNKNNQKRKIQKIFDREASQDLWEAQNEKKKSYSKRGEREKKNFNHRAHKQSEGNSSNSSEYNNKK